MRMTMLFRLHPAPPPQNMKKNSRRQKKEVTTLRNLQGWTRYLKFQPARPISTNAHSAKMS